MSREIPRDLTAAEKELYLAVRQGDLLETTRILRQARELPAQDLAAACLTKGLYACPELFEKLLEWCPEPEYTGEVHMTAWPWRSAADGTDWSLRGTMVTLAAALNKPRHLQMLLERGMDVNGVLLPQENPCGYIEISGYVEICDMTPLAAAVAFGAVDCVEHLLRQSGIRLAECPSVSAALLLPHRDWNENYRKACRLVRTYGMDETQERKLTLWAAVQNCTPCQLQEELEHHTYTEKELALAAQSIFVERRDGLLEKLLLLEQACPAAVHAPDVSRKLLEYLFLCEEQWRWPGVLPLTVRVCQGVADVSLVGKHLCMLEPAWIETVLRLLCKDSRCVMDRDAVPCDLSARKLRVLLKYVEFSPVLCREGISGLSCAILRTGDVHLIQKALKNGLISDDESTERLLQFQKEVSVNPSVRMLLLCRRQGQRNA